MKASTIGIAFIILGIIMVSYTGINLMTTKNVVDMGPIQIDRQVSHPVQWSPVVGIVLIIGGIVLVLRGRKGRE